jgi:hypothetical protein
MCGVFGFASKDQAILNAASLRTIADSMFRYSETRGREAAGIAVVTADTIGVHKDSVSASRMLRTPGYRHFMASHGAQLERDVTQEKLSFLAFIGHARLVTTGLQAISQNNQPVSHSGSVAIHNGIIVNYQELWRESGLTPSADVDSEVLPALVQMHRKAGCSMKDAIARTFAAINGEATAAFLFDECNIMAIATNTGSVYYLHDRARGSFAFTSEYYISKMLASASALSGIVGRAEVQQLAPNHVLLINLDTLESEVSPLDAAKVAAGAVVPLLATQRRIEQRYDMDERSRRDMRRCTRCLLPETMPFIDFDAEGVCNYCRSYQPIVLQGRAALEARLAKHRGSNGIGDCLVAFSGGRDSSYGLHLLTKEFGLRPVAYTYDWGMVTDLARRNQARLCGALGIEHIWVSADIKRKRAFIRANVEAWLKRPSLGMVPLFMAGDKQFFWYANQTMRQTGLHDVIFCANILEKTDFKSGFASIAPAALKSRQSNGKPFYNLGGVERFKIAAYYGGQFLANPNYWNRSLPDTAFAYASYYVFKQPFINIFDYLPWREEVVNSVLIETYDWERAKDTNTTWRIGDGTAPFYNYIYRQVAGFTEFDTFRSNQIREGHLTRAQAATRVEEENQPRWESIRDYCLLINIDFEECIRRIDRIPKLYIEMHDHA